MRSRLRLNSESASVVVCGGNPAMVADLDFDALREFIEIVGAEFRSGRLADVEPDFEAFVYRFTKWKERDPLAGGYGNWIKPLGRWDWWDLGGRFDGLIVGERRHAAGESSMVSSGPSRGRDALGRILRAFGAESSEFEAEITANAAVAVRALQSASSSAIPDALADGSLSIVGDPAVANWFGDLVRLARGRAQDTRAAKPPVSVIGLGRMGSGIAHSLLRAGFPVTVYNRTSDEARPLVEAGATAAATPAAAARAARFVITSLMGDASVSAVVEGPEGLLAGLAPGGVHIGASTISAKSTNRLVALHAVHGSDYLAAPVVGRPDTAASGELVTLVCGPQSVFEASREFLQGYTRQIQYLGENHAVASDAKLAVNYTAATIIDLMGQVYAFGEKTGIPLTALHIIFRMLWAQPVMQGYATRIWKRDFNDVGFDVQGGLKDVTLMLDAAHRAHVRWDFAETIQPKMARASEMGLGSKDWSSVYEVTRADAGLVA